MKSLVVDALSFSYTPIGETGEIHISSSNWSLGEQKVFSNCILIFIAIEKNDGARQLRRATNEYLNLSRILLGNNIVLMPNVHLTHRPVSSETAALKFFEDLKEALVKKSNIPVQIGPFGTFGPWQLVSQATPTSTLGRSF